MASVETSDDDVPFVEDENSSDSSISFNSLHFSIRSNLPKGHRISFLENVMVKGCE